MAEDGTLPGDILAYLDRPRPQLPGAGGSTGWSSKPSSRGSPRSTGHGGQAPQQPRRPQTEGGFSAVSGGAASSNSRRPTSRADRGWTSRVTRERLNHLLVSGPDEFGGPSGDTAGGGRSRSPSPTKSPPRTARPGATHSTGFPVVITEDAYTLQAHTTEYRMPVPLPSTTPGTREQTIQLQQTLDKLLRNLQASVPDDERQMSLEAVYDVIREEQIIFNVVFHELIRQVSIGCQEQGALLTTVRKAYVSQFSRAAAVVEQLLEANRKLVAPPEKPEDEEDTTAAELYRCKVDLLNAEAKYELSQVEVGSLQEQLAHCKERLDVIVKEHHRLTQVHLRQIAASRIQRIYRAKMEAMSAMKVSSNDTVTVAGPSQIAAQGAPTSAGSSQSLRQHMAASRIQQSFRGFSMRRGLLELATAKANALSDVAVLIAEEERRRQAALAVAASQARAVLTIQRATRARFARQQGAMERSRVLQNRLHESEIEEWRGKVQELHAQLDAAARREAYLNNQLANMRETTALSAHVDSMLHRIDGLRGLQVQAETLVEHHASVHRAATMRAQEMHEAAQAARAPTPGESSLMGHSVATTQSAHLRSLPPSGFSTPGVLTPVASHSTIATVDSRGSVGTSAMFMGSAAQSVVVKRDSSASSLSSATSATGRPVSRETSLSVGSHKEAAPANKTVPGPVSDSDDSDGDITVVMAETEHDPALAVSRLQSLMSMTIPVDGTDVSRLGTAPAPAHDPIPASAPRPQTPPSIPQSQPSSRRPSMKKQQPVAVVEKVSIATQTDDGTVSRSGSVSSFSAIYRPPTSQGMAQSVFLPFSTTSVTPADSVVSTRPSSQQDYAPYVQRVGSQTRVQDLVGPLSRPGSKLQMRASPPAGFDLVDPAALPDAPPIPMPAHLAGFANAASAIDARPRRPSRSSTPYQLAGSASGTTTATAISLSIARPASPVLLQVADVHAGGPVAQPESYSRILELVHSNIQDVDATIASPRFRPAAWVIPFTRDVLDKLGDMFSSGTGMQGSYPRLPDAVFSLLSDRFGLRMLIDTKGLELVCTLVHLRASDPEADIFARFLDEVWPPHELHVYVRARRAMLSANSRGCRVIRSASGSASPRQGESFQIHVDVERASAVVSSVLQSTWWSDDTQAPSVPNLPAFLVGLNCLVPATWFVNGSSARIMDAIDSMATPSSELDALASSTSGPATHLDARPPLPPTDVLRKVTSALNQAVASHRAGPTSTNATSGRPGTSNRSAGLPSPTTKRRWVTSTSLLHNIIIEYRKARLLRRVWQWMTIMFRFVDQDGDGFVTLQEFIFLFQFMYPKRGQRELQQEYEGLVKQASTQMLSRDGFIKAVHSLALPCLSFALCDQAPTTLAATDSAHLKQGTLVLMPLQQIFSNAGAVEESSALVIQAVANHWATIRHDVVNYAKLLMVHRRPTDTAIARELDEHIAALERCLSGGSDLSVTAHRALFELRRILGVVLTHQGDWHQLGEYPPLDAMNSELQALTDVILTRWDTMRSALTERGGVHSQSTERLLCNDEARTHVM